MGRAGTAARAGGREVRVEDASAVVAAVITAAAAVVAVVVAQLLTARRERRARSHERERAALLDLQDAALLVRSALRATGTAIATAAPAGPASTHVVVVTPPDLEAAQSDADGRLDVRLARVGSGEVVAATRHWQRCARFAFLGDEDVTTRDELEAWAALQEAVAVVLRAGRPPTP